MKKIHRFVADLPLGGSEAALVEPELVHQIYRVLKLRAGERIIVSDGKGSDATAEIISCDDASCRVKIAARETLSRRGQVALYAAVLKKENFEWAAEKGVEAGAAEIIPVLSERTVKSGVKIERLRKIVREAAEQSGNPFVADLIAPLNFPDALLRARPNAVNWFFDPSGEDLARAIGAAAAGEGAKPGTIGVWIGPEGGWSADELAAAKAAGFRVVSLGRLILRAETAAAVAVYLAAR